jgi:hypothetical protein
MGWFIGVLAVSVVALGAGYDLKRQRERLRVSRPEISRWEEDGGAVPPDSGRRTAQTTTH